MCSPLSHICALILCIPSVLTGHALAQTPIAVPNGWTDAAPPDGRVFASGSDRGGRKVLMIVGSAVAGEPATDAWLDKQADLISEAFGRITWRQGLAREETLLKDALTLTSDEGQILHVLLFGYDTGSGGQPFALVFPKPVKLADSRVQAGLDAIAGNWRSRAAVGADGATPARPAPEPAATGAGASTPAPSPHPAAGRNCRTVERYKVEQQMQMRCWPNRGCNMEPVQATVPYNVEVCD